MSRWGVGPKIFVPCLIYALATWAATSAWPDALELRRLPDFARTIGAVLAASGVLMWIASIITLERAYTRDRLVTSGVFALARHPLYAAWIMLIFPGLAFLTGSWPMLLTPCIGYAIFKHVIHVEDDYLERRFGLAYLEYRRRVNEIIPVPRFWLRHGS